MLIFIYNYNFVCNIWVGGKFKMIVKKRWVCCIMDYCNI